MTERLREVCVEYSPALSKGGGVLIAALAPFVVWKYFNTGTNPFNEQSAILSILSAATLVHLIFAFLMKYSNNHSLIFSFCTCLVSGVVAIELILFILFNQIWKLLAINVSVALLVALVCFLNNLLSLFSVPALSNCFRCHERQEPGGDVEMTNAEESAV